LSNQGYRIAKAARFSKTFNRLPKQYQKSIGKKLELFVYPQLKTDPHTGSNIKKLQNYHPDTWRYRIGNYRVFYHIDDQEKIVYLLRVGHRKNVYR